VQNLAKPEDRRRRPRYAVSEIVEVYVVGAGGGYLGCGVLKDVSEGGVGVHMDAPVTPNTAVEITNHRGSIRAVARHNKPAFSGYVIGFEFVDGPDLVNVWSPLPATW
jgi:hypothetical protein